MWLHCSKLGLDGQVKCVVFFSLSIYSILNNLPENADVVILKFVKILSCNR